MSKWEALIVIEKEKLAAHVEKLHKLAHLHKVAKKAAEKMKIARVKAEADAEAANKSMLVALKLKNLEIKKSKIAKHDAIEATKRMIESISRAKKAVARRLIAEANSRKANHAMKDAVKWAIKMLHAKKIA